MAENISTQHRIIQNFHLIWYDRTIDQSDDDSQKPSIDQLQTTFQMIHKFSDMKQCIDFLTDIQCEKVFMIISNSLDQNLIFRIHDIPQLDSIYIYHPKTPINEEWIQNWSKIKGSFQQDAALIESLKQRARQYDQNSTPISIISPNVQLNQNLDQLDPTFIYTQMLKEILFEIKYNERSINDLVQYIRTYYLNNEAQLKTISRFEQTYDEKSSIWWYTSEVFIYSILNKALRTLEVDTIIEMGVFIRDLHMNIKGIYEKEKKKEAHEPQFTVYRGQGISHKDFEKLHESLGGLFSFNNFLSTSRDRDVSWLLADSNTVDRNLVGILFQMEINESFSSTPYADLSKISQFKSEDEILFSMNAIFRIEQMEPLDSTKRLWQVNLTITSDTDQDLVTLADHMRKETEQLTGWSRLIPLLMKLGEFKKAEQVCETLLQTTLKDHEKASIYGQLGNIYDNLSNYTQAILFYKKALNVMSQLDSWDVKSLASMYNNIGLVYKNLDDRKNALLFLEKSLELYEKVLPAKDPAFGVIYNNMGSMYDLLGEQSKALDFFEKSMSFSDTLPKNHPELAMTYKNIGRLYKDIGDFSKALEYMQKALGIEDKTLPKDHPTFALTYNNMGNLYRNLGDFSQAKFFHEKAIEISKKNNKDGHLDVVDGYANICSVYLEIGEYSKAISEAEKAIKIGRNFFNEDHHLLAGLYNIIGMAWCYLEELEKAFSFCRKSLDIFERKSDGNPLDLANGYISVGSICMKKNQYGRALAFFEKGRIIQERIFPSDHPHLANTYTNIGHVFYNMNDYRRALFYCGKGLIIRRKTLPQYHPMLMRSCMSVAEPLIGMGKFLEARLACKEAVEIARHSLPINNEERQMCEKTYALLEKVTNNPKMTLGQIWNLLQE